jgi:hypothetical protein
MCYLQTSRLAIDIRLTTGYMGHMNWDEKYQKGEAFWDKGIPAPAMKQYLARHAVRKVEGQA